MRNKYQKVSMSCTEADYAAGRHQQWECESHEAGEDFLRKHKREWTHIERAVWIDTYLSTHNDYERNLVRTCNVCSAVIADALLNGVNPFKVPAMVKQRLAALGVRIRSNEVLLHVKQAEH